MNIFVILGIIWVVYVGHSMIKKNGKKGGVILAFLILTGVVWASGDKLGFNGGVAALIFSVIFMFGMYIYDKRMCNK